jgi:hypothetical protein
MMETLEGRTLLSAAVASTMNSDLVFAAASSASAIQGYTPAQIDQAYNINQISFGSGTVAANGAGQTIAIVDAYNDPNISSDLSVFDSEFDLPAANLKVVSQTGTSKLPATDAGWAGEISLDVEWAHAIAPGANILLVEASSDDTTNLIDAVNYARSAAGVSVVSMSWGGSEFFSFNGGTESESQLAYDPDFTTPAGHQGVTFVAAAGDSGSRAGVDWPASSPNVLSVGGTTLMLSDTGAYESEAGWSGTQSGYSQVETEPAYQDTVQDTGTRSVADVSFDADPNTGLAVYDSVSYEGVSGWQEVGGTSAGAPAWSAIVAIADQGRTLAGEGTLDGASQTLPSLYDLYSAPGTTDYSTYTSDFNDISTGGGGTRAHFRWGGNGASSSSAAAGYDTITGLGTPEAATLVDALVGSSASSTGGTGTGGTTPGEPTVPATLSPAPLDGSIPTVLPVAIVGGKAGALKLNLDNVSGITFSGPVTVTLYASADGTLSSDDTAITTFSYAKVSAKAGHTTYEVLRFDYPTDLTGSNYLIASISTGTDTEVNNAVTSKAVNITPPTVDLSATFASTAPVKIDPGHDASTIITITNDGNVTASGTLDLALDASTDGVLIATDPLLSSISGRKISIGAGKSIKIKLVFKSPDNLVGGTFDLTASITSSTLPSDSNTSNNTATTDTIST